MTYTNYSDMAERIARLQPFDGNSARAVMHHELYEYQVFSYGTLIAVFSLKTGTGVLNARKYSRTTSRLQNIIRSAWKNETLTETV